MKELGNGDFRGAGEFGEKDGVERLEGMVQRRESVRYSSVYHIGSITNGD
jgi:hypothetical protein